MAIILYHDCLRMDGNPETCRVDAISKIDGEHLNMPPKTHVDHAQRCMDSAQWCMAAGASCDRLYLQTSECKNVRHRYGAFTHLRSKNMRTPSGRRCTIFSGHCALFAWSACSICDGKFRLIRQHFEPDKYVHGSFRRVRLWLVDRSVLP